MNADVVDLFNDWADLAIRDGESSANVALRAERLGIPYLDAKIVAEWPVSLDHTPVARFTIT